MKQLIQLIIAHVFALSSINSNANISVNQINLFPAINNPHTDPLALLQQNYPAIYSHLIQHFNRPQGLLYSVKENTIYVSFKNNNNTVSAVYTKKGEMNYTVENIGLKLPFVISEQLKKEFPAWSVFYGKHILANNKSVYEIVIENEEEYRVINFNDTEIMEIQRLKK